LTNTDFNDLFSRFLREKEILDRCTPKTIASYRDAWQAFVRFAGCTCEITAARLKQWVMTMTEAELTPRSINSFASGINSFLTWLAENDHIPERLRVPLQSVPRRVLTTYSVEDARKILNAKPQFRSDRRLLAILHLLIDTGARIDEVLSLTRDAVDWSNLLVKLYGKGQKERIVPISVECRKVLYRWANSHNHTLLFPNRSGGKLQFNNLRRDFLRLLDAVKVPKTEGAFHAFRRFAARQYLRSGGSTLYLRQLLGHSDLATTTRYVEESAEDLQLAHRIHSPLEAVKGSRQR
jgi:site-specific recombinase XerD